VIFGKKHSGSLPAVGKLPAPDFETNPPGLPLTVVYTTIEATLAALRCAAQLAVQLEAQIRVLVLQTVPYPLPLDRPQVDPAFRIRHFMTHSENESIETHIDVLLCRDADKCLLQTLQPQSLVLIGSHRRFWFTREKQWGKKLRNAGHHVILVPAIRESKPFGNRFNRARRIAFQAIVHKYVRRLTLFFGAGQQAP
jgi:hypothetical protein